MFGLFKKKGEKKEMSKDECCGSGCCSDNKDGCAHEASAEKQKKHGDCGRC